MDRLKTLVLSLGLCLLSGLPSGAAQKTIVFLGDSLTAGYGLPEENAYPHRIQEYLQRDGFDWQVINAGISGDTTKGGSKRIRWILKSSPSVVFVALGANDGLRGVPVSESRSNLEAIVLELKKSGVEVVIAGMQLPRNYGSDYSKSFKSVFPQIAEKYKLRLYPFLLDGVALHPELNQADGIHPNEKGQEIIAGKVYRFLKPLLEKVPPR
jgi:acyl-CoA thioesterase-1